jgi:GDP-D-mannose dehydratase
MSFVAVSWVQSTLTAEFTGVGVTRMLEAVREVWPEARIYQASSSEMFGKVKQVAMWIMLQQDEPDDYVIAPRASRIPSAPAWKSPSIRPASPSATTSRSTLRSVAPLRLAD